MLTSIFALITGLAGPVSNVAGQIVAYKTALLNSKSDVEKAAINERIEALHDKSAVLNAEIGTRVGAFLFAIPQFFIGLSVASILTKILFWDKVIGSFYGCGGQHPNKLLAECYTFNTDPLDSNLWGIVGIAVSFYFVSNIWKSK